VLQVVPGRERAVAERVSERHAFFRALLRAAGVEAVVADEEACRLEHCLCEDSFPELVRDCFALSYCILKKNQGVWRLLTETMFPGYLFVASDDIEAFEKTIKRSTAFARLLGAERRAFALRPEEASFVHDFGGGRPRGGLSRRSPVVGFSRGTIDNGRTIIDEGPLRGHVDRIKKIDRHKRIAYLDIGLLDQKQVRVGLEIVRKT